MSKYLIDTGVTPATIQLVDEVPSPNPNPNPTPNPQPQPNPQPPSSIEVRPDWDPSQTSRDDSIQMGPYYAIRVQIPNRPVKDAWPAVRGSIAVWQDGHGSGSGRIQCGWAADPSAYVPRAPEAVGAGGSDTADLTFDDVAGRVMYFMYVLGPDMAPSQVNVSIYLPTPA